MWWTEGGSEIGVIVIVIGVLGDHGVVVFRCDLNGGLMFDCIIVVILRSIEIMICSSL